MLLKRQTEAVRELQDRLSKLRQLVAVIHGAGQSSQILALRGRIGRQPDKVHEQARVTLVRLAKLKPGETRLPGLTADPEAWTAMLEPAVEALEAVNQALAVQDKIIEGLVIKKRQAFADFDRTLRSLVRTIEGLANLVDDTKLARRIRQFTRKRQKPGPKKKRQKAT